MSRSGIGRINAGQCAQQRRRIGYGARHGSSGVLRRGNRNDARATEKAHGGLQTHDAAGRRGRDDGSIGLGADGHGAQVGRYGCARTGAGARGAAVEHVRIARETSTSAPAGNGTMASEIGPFAEVGLAQNHGSRRAEPGNNERILGCCGAGQRQRTRGRLHAVASVDVVLDEHRHAMERATRALRTPFVIQRSSHGHGLGIQLDDRVKTGAVAVESVNSLKEVVGESLRGERTRGHASLDLGHGKFRQGARSANRSGDAPRQASQRSCRQRCQAQAVEKLSPVCHVVRSTGV